jgi:hypothetical protein
MKQTTATVVAASVLSVSLIISALFAAPRYQFTYVGDDWLIRLNKQNGEICAIAWGNNESWAHSCRENPYETEDLIMADKDSWNFKQPSSE